MAKLTPVDELLAHWGVTTKPTKGFYVSNDTAKELLATLRGTAAKPKKAAKVETRVDIHKRIKDRFKNLGEFTSATLKGTFTSLFIQGPPGLGKTFEVERMLTEYDPNEINTRRVAGKITAAALVKVLWDHREKGQIVVFDDCDSVFKDAVSLNLLKAATDSGKKRVVSYVTEGPLKVSEKDASLIPSSFEFAGTIIFITNIDFDDLIEKGDELAKHLEAIKDRAHYVSLGMRTREDYMIRVEQINEDADFGDEIIAFMWDHLDTLDRVNARTAHKLCGLKKAFSSSWKAKAMEGCMKAA